MHFEYTCDWRLQSALFRHYGGAKHLLHASRRAKVVDLFWIALLLFAAPLALRTQSWAFLAIVAMVLVWRGTLLVMSFRAPRLAAFALRKSFRDKQKRRIMLVIANDGLHETDNGIESFAPWASVVDYFVAGDVVGVHLNNGLSAYVPGFALSAESSSTRALVERLDANGIKRSTGQGDGRTTAPPLS